MIWETTVSGASMKCDFFSEGGSEMTDKASDYFKQFL